MGGLRDAANSVSRLHLVTAFGRKLSTQLRQLIQFNEDTHTVANTLNESWITATINAIGSEEPDAGPPAEAIKSVKELIAEACDFTPSTSRTKLTKVDADLLEAWRMAASHPDNYIAKWMGVGAPAGILNPIPDPGFFRHSPSRLPLSRLICTAMPIPSRITLTSKPPK